LNVFGLDKIEDLYDKYNIDELDHQMDGAIGDGASIFAFYNHSSQFREENETGWNPPAVGRAAGQGSHEDGY